MAEPNGEQEKITFSGPGGVRETLSRDELNEQWNLIHALKEQLAKIKPVGRWMRSINQETNSEDGTT